MNASYVFSLIFSFFHTCTITYPLPDNLLHGPWEEEWPSEGTRSDQTFYPRFGGDRSLEAARGWGVQTPTTMPRLPI